jgi:hypothetical protein
MLNTWGFLFVGCLRGFGIIDFETHRHIRTHKVPHKNQFPLRTLYLCEQFVV